MSNSQVCKFLEERDGSVTVLTLMRHLKITMAKAREIMDEWKWGKG